MTNSKFILTATVAVAAAILLLSSTANRAWAHGFTTVPLPSDPTHRGLKVTIGEQNEPAFIEGLHNIDLIINDQLTGLPIGNAQTSSVPLKIDAFFYPAGTTPAIDGSDPGPFTAHAGYTDSKLNQTVKGVFGKLGSYTAANQFYTKEGRTLYHLYGNINYFKDEEVPIDIWTDGGSVKKGFSGSTALTFGGAFGLNDVTTAYWPGSTATDSPVTASNYPDSVRGALGAVQSDISTIKSDTSATKANTIDIFNFLTQIAQAINQLFSGSQTPITIPPTK